MADNSQSQVQLIHQLMGETGQRALPYAEDVKWVVGEHLIELIKSMPTLNVGKQEYIHNDGRSVSLLKLGGTMPMYYQSVKYNIPVEIWIPEKYPREAPIVYVRPTPDMIIKPNHSCVDASGLVLTPYIREHWNFTGANLIDMAYDMAIMFGQEPPLFSKPPGHKEPPPPTAHTYTPPAANPGVFQGSNPMVRPNYPPSSTSAGYGYGAASNPSHHPGHPSGHQGHRPSGNQGYWGSQYGHQSTAAQPPGGNQGGHAQNVSKEFRAAAIKGLSERLTVSMEAYSSQVSKEMEQLMETQEKLSARAPELQNAISSLHEERGLLEARVRMLAMKTGELTEWLQQVGDKAEELDADVDVNTVIVPEDALCQQALETQAEDMAVEDTLYAMDKALQNGHVQLDAYLKQVRQLCRRQFFARAQGMKVAETQHQIPPSISATNNNSGARQNSGVLMPQGDSWATSGMLRNPLVSGQR